MQAAGEAGARVQERPAEGGGHDGYTVALICFGMGITVAQLSIGHSVLDLGSTVDRCRSLDHHERHGRRSGEARGGGARE